MLHLKKKTKPNSLGFRKHTELNSAFTYIYKPPTELARALSTQKKHPQHWRPFPDTFDLGLPVHCPYLRSASKPEELPLASPLPPSPLYWDLTFPPDELLFDCTSAISYHCINTASHHRMSLCELVNECLWSWYWANATQLQFVNIAQKSAQPYFLKHFYIICHVKH